MKFHINGNTIDADIDLRVSLLDLLRDHLHLTGSKKGCNQGACGACTVLVDGQRINSCLALAVQYQGRKIVTVEGLGSAGKLHPLQQAFIEHDGFQCGYCTPGQLCSAVGMMDEVRRGMPSVVTVHPCAQTMILDHDEVRERMSGNLCRCGAYNGIIDAITETFEAEGSAQTAGQSQPQVSSQPASQSTSQPTSQPSLPASRPSSQPTAQSVTAAEVA
ncbi:MAG: 2Fe-2S iron-sulfur cluster-binding protein [Janthinobacterium lividum]